MLEDNECTFWSHKLGKLFIFVLGHLSLDFFHFFELALLEVISAIFEHSKQIVVRKTELNAKQRLFFLLELFIVFLMKWQLIRDLFDESGFELGQVSFQLLILVIFRVTIRKIFPDLLRDFTGEREVFRTDKVMITLDHLNLALDEQVVDCVLIDKQHQDTNE